MAGWVQGLASLTVRVECPEVFGFPPLGPEAAKLSCRAHHSSEVHSLSPLTGVLPRQRPAARAGRGPWCGLCTHGCRRGSAYRTVGEESRGRWPVLYALETGGFPSQGSPL